MTQGTRMIENSDRGITLNKSLAWSIAVGLIGAGLYVGVQVATLSTRIETMGDIAASAARERQDLSARIKDVETTHSARIGSLERAEARSSERYTAILNLVMKIDSRLERMEQSRGQ